MFNFDVASGKLVACTANSTRNEQDFLKHIQNRIAAEPQTTQWHFVCDNLNIHMSASLVRYVAEESDVNQDLGVKGRSGILKTKASRAEFLSDPTHKIVFHYTSKHAPWMNQVEIWLSILVRKVIKQGNFSSIKDLQRKVPLLSNITTAQWQDLQMDFSRQSSCRLTSYLLMPSCTSLYLLL